MRIRNLALFAALLLVVAACGAEGGDDTTTTADDSGTTTTTADAGQEETTTSSTVAESMDGVHVADSELGSILVDPDGFTLYVFTADTGGESACYEACAELWPPLPADTSISSDLDSSIFGSTTRTDGSEQLTVNGMPLYLYTPDAEPGDVLGQGFNGVWFVVDPDGTMIEAAADDNVVIDYDY